MKFYANPQDAYSAHQTVLRRLLGTDQVEYSALSQEARTAVNNNLLTLTKYLYDATDRPSFVLFDFGVLHDANLLSQTNPNSQLQTALNYYVANQINYLAGYAAAQSTPFNAFLDWAEADANNSGCPASKVICTSYYVTCKNPTLQQEINSALILQSAFNAHDVLQHGVGINNGLRLAALYDSAAVQESSRVILDKACNDILRDIPLQVEFMQQLKGTDLAEAFTINSTNSISEMSAKQWEDEQYTRVTNLMKQAKREAIRQGSLTEGQARLEAIQREDNLKHEQYVATLNNNNDIVSRHNVAATEANAANAQSNVASRLAAYYQADSNRYSAESRHHTQASLGGGAQQHSLTFSMSTSRQSGLTLSANHSIHQGDRLVASASTRYNSVESYNQRVAFAVAQAQARQTVTPMPLRVSEPLSQLREFVAQNSQNLRGFEVPDFPANNPYALRSDVFLQDFVPGSTQTSNYGQHVVEQTYTVDRAATVQRMAFNPDGKFNNESDNSSWNISIRQFQQNNWQPVTASNINEAFGNKPRSLLGKAGDIVSDAILGLALNVIGGRYAEASPVIASSGILTQGIAAPGIITGNRSSVPPVTLKGLATEAVEVVNKTLLLASMLNNPAVAQHVYGILTTPVHQMDNEDTMGDGNEAFVDTSLPPYNEHAIDQNGHMLPGSTGRLDLPNEMVNVPPRTDGFLMMFRERMASGEVMFKRWSRGEEIDQQLSDGTAPTWSAVRARYWKNRYEEAKDTGEFDKENLKRMRRGFAPQDYNPRTGQMESRELHHIVPQREQGPNTVENLSELTPDQHAEVDPYRRVRGLTPNDTQ